MRFCLRPRASQSSAARPINRASTSAGRFLHQLDCRAPETIDMPVTPPTSPFLKIRRSLPPMAFQSRSPHQAAFQNPRIRSCFVTQSTSLHSIQSPRITHPIARPTAPDQRMFSRPPIFRPTLCIPKPSTSPGPMDTRKALPQTDS